jgi:predicted nuclease with RNAse H fold
VTLAARRWAGVDVGAKRKGFHVAFVDDRRLVAPVRSAPTVSAVVEELTTARPAVVAIDGPSSAAPDKARSRDCEKQLATSRICGIRYTPDRATVYSDHPTGYYDWIKHGLELYAALRSGGMNWHVIEVFPTASFSRWVGRRPAGTSRARWTRRALEDLGLEHVPAGLNQDERDAIAAALTARLYPNGIDSFGEIVVPRGA